MVNEISPGIDHEVPVNPTAQPGWQCPVCRRVYSPLVTMCPFCGGAFEITCRPVSDGVMSQWEDRADFFPGHGVRLECGGKTNMEGKAIQ